MGTWRRYLIKRTGFAVMTIFIAASLNFFIFRAAPGSPADHVSRVPTASPETIANLERQFGVDKPIPEQYVLYLKELAQGNLGISFENRQPVVDNLRDALGNTLRLVVPGTLLGITLGIVVALIAAWRRGGIFDRVGSITALVCYATPTQWLGLMLITLFAGALPAGGMQDNFLLDPSFAERAADIVRHTLLPAITLSFGVFGLFTTIVRSSLLETLGEDYILAARAKGMRNWAVIRRHAFPNAMLPTVTVIALMFGSLVSGAILIETVFSWPGMGRAMYDAIGKRDYPMLQGAFLLLSVCVIAANYVADLLYFRLDPRARVS